MNQLRNRILTLHFLVVAALYFTGCSAWSPANRAGTAKLLESDALAILEPAGVSLLQGLAAGEKLDGKTLKSVAWQSLSIPVMAKVIQDAGGGMAIAGNAAVVARKAMSKKGASEADAAAAALKAIQSGAR